MRADGWSEAKLRELVVAGGLQTGPFGGQLHADEYVADGVPVVMPQDIISGEISTEHIARVSEEKAASLAQHRLRTGDLVFARRGDIGRVGITRDRETGWLCGTGCLRARPSERVSPAYLHYAVRRASSIAWLNIHAVGQTMLNLNTSILGQLPADVPPLPEQRAIAAVLDTIDDAIQKTEQIIAKLQQVKQGLLHDLLTRGIDDNGELRDPERHPEQFQDSPLGRIPRGWRSTTLGEIATWTSGGTPSKTIPAYWTGDIPWVSPKDMKAFELADTQDHVSSAGVAAGSRLVPKETVLIVVRGMILAHTFPVCIAMQAMALNQDVKGLIPSTTVRGRYLGHWLVSHSPQLLTLVTEATHGTKRIELRDIQTIAFGSPPRSEQDEVLRRVDALGVQLHAEAAALQKLRLMKSGISDDLLSGRVRTTSLPEFAA